MQIPEGKVHARVENGWVTLDGEVEYEYQRHEVERMVRHVRGVAGVTDTHHRQAAGQPGEPSRRPSRRRFRREAEVDARHVRVEVSDHTAKLYGHVHSLREAAPRRPPRPPLGIAEVESHLVVTP